MRRWLEKAGIIQRAGLDENQPRATSTMLNSGDPQVPQNCRSTALPLSPES
jgi:hypothetical protein